MLTPEEQKQLDALLNKERATEVVESAPALQAGNTTKTLAPETHVPKQTVEGTPTQNGVTVFGQKYRSNGLTREWTK
jgi:hypothetical protein